MSLLVKALVSRPAVVIVRPQSSCEWFLVPRNIMCSKKWANPLLPGSGSLRLPTRTRVKYAARPGESNWMSTAVRPLGSLTVSVGEGNAWVRGARGLACAGSARAASKAAATAKRMGPPADKGAECSRGAAGRVEVRDLLDEQTGAWQQTRPTVRPGSSVGRA